MFRIRVRTQATSLQLRRGVLAPHHLRCTKSFSPHSVHGLLCFKGFAARVGEAPRELQRFCVASCNMAAARKKAFNKHLLKWKSRCRHPHCSLMFGKA